MGFGCGQAGRAVTVRAAAAVRAAAEAAAESGVAAAVAAGISAAPALPTRPHFFLSPGGGGVGVQPYDAEMCRSRTCRSSRSPRAARAPVKIGVCPFSQTRVCSTVRAHHNNDFIQEIEQSSHCLSPDCLGHKDAQLYQVYSLYHGLGPGSLLIKISPVTSPL